MRIVLFAGAVLAVCMFASSAMASEKEVLLAKLTVMRVTGSFTDCHLYSREADLLYRGNRLSEMQAKLKAMHDCIEGAPKKIKPSIDQLRKLLTNKPKAQAALKDFYLSYQEALRKLGSSATPPSEAARYASVLEGKGARIIAEIEY